MKKILGFLLFFLLLNSSHASLFDDIFDTSKDFQVPTVSLEVKKPTSISNTDIKIVEKQFEKMKSKLEKYSDSKKIDVYEQASKNITKLIKSRSKKTEKDFLEYLNALVKKEISLIKSSQSGLESLFGITDDVCSEGYIYKDGDCRAKSFVNPNDNNIIKRFCSINNGSGTQYLQNNSRSYCYVTQCNDGYYISNNSCVRYDNSYYDNGNNCYNRNCNYNTRSCSISNGYGRQTWNGSYWSSCYAESCNSGYYLSGNSCVKEYLYCGDNQHYDAGSCISNTRSCSVSNGYGRQTWNGNSWGSCYVDYCNSGYYISGNSCIRNYDSCGANQHYENGYCTSNTRSCSVSNGYGRQTWNGNSWNSCYAESCNSGYYLSGGSCIRNYDSCGTNQHYENGYCTSNTRSCSVSNGYGRQTWNGNSWNSCYAESCNSGYYLSGGSCIRNYDSCGANQHYENGYCTSNTRSCSVSNGYGRQTWNGNSWGSCYVDYCNSGYYISGNYCYRY